MYLNYVFLQAVENIYICILVFIINSILILYYIHTTIQEKNDHKKLNFDIIFLTKYTVVIVSR